VKLLLAPIVEGAEGEVDSLEALMPHLHFHEGGRPLFLHLLRPGRTVIGRSDRCDVALPSESVSRVHCVLERRMDGWWLTDRSKHGTRVNGAAITSHQLSDGDEVAVGIYNARFSLKEDASLRLPTATHPVLPAVHEELVDITDEGFAAGRAELRFTRGPLTGRTVILMQARTSLGGPGSGVQLSEALSRGIAHLRVVRGRVMVEPSELGVFLGGVRVREITPVHPGEEIRLGEHAMVIDSATVEEIGPALDGFGEMVGRTPVMRRLFGVLARVAAHEAPVLLTGESGTGKELAARGIHDASPRAAGPFVTVNCAAIPETLVESELFGHEKGSFTGAAQRQDGAFQRANGGTLFLDELGELRPDAQASLLRALESGEVRRVGGQAPEFPDVRVIAATNRNLPEMVNVGKFRQDLYFRMAVLTVRLPSLRERREDLTPLARALVERHHPGARLGDDALAALQDYDWPGNVRELRNVLTRAFVLAGPFLSAGDLTFNPWAFEGEPTSPLARRSGDDPEKRQVVEALRRANGNRTKAANLLGIPRSSLLYKMKKHGVDTA
jgi:DNA-binding NtrC family response regulator